MMEITFKAFEKRFGASVKKSLKNGVSCSAWFVPDTIISEFKLSPGHSIVVNNVVMKKGKSSIIFYNRTTKENLALIVSGSTSK